jgi:HK97 family phage prohead protease
MVNLVPTEQMAKNAKRGLEMRREFNRGGTAVGVARARSIANRQKLSPKTVNRMVSFFARHAVDSEAEGYRAGEPGYPSAGKIANLLWGGPAAYAWAKRKQRELEKTDEVPMKKVFHLEDIKLYQDNDERKFEGYASTFGNMDRQGDVVDQGAFAKSLSSHNAQQTMPAMLLHHDLKRPIGRWTSMVEDQKGLRVTGTLTAGVRDADEAYALLKDGAINSMSIGYRVRDEEYDTRSKTNHLKEIDLHEVSLVTIPANASAIVSAVKDEAGDINIRELETVLRDAGLSRKEAKAILADGFKALDDDEEELIEKAQDECDAQPEMDRQRLQAMLDKLTSIKSKTK